MSGLTKMSTATYSTKRNPAMSSSKRSVSVAKLSSVASVPIMPAVAGQGAMTPMPISDPIRGQQLDLYETYIEYQTHVDSSVTVTQLPDVKENDMVVVGSVNYKVRRVETWPATSSLLSYLRVLLEESQA